MTNMSIQPLWLTHFIEILLVLEFQLTKLIVGAFSYKAHFRPQISSNGESKKQPIVSISSAEAECVAATMTACHAFCLKQILMVLLFQLIGGGKYPEQH